MTEIWRPAPRFDGVYEVSNLGRVRRLKRKKGAKVGGTLKGLTMDTGHVLMTLRDDPRVESIFLHRLVLEAFVGPCPEGMEGCHNNGDPSDNRLENLRWDTRSGNRYDSVRHGTHVQTRKTHCPRGHILQKPNLDPYRWAKGHRLCLSCCKARKYAWHHKVEMTQELADSYYADIMSTYDLAA